MLSVLFHPVVLAVMAALLPVVLLLFYIYRQDAAQPEPVRWLWRAVLYGVASALLVMLVVGPLPDLYTCFPALRGTAVGAILFAFLEAAIPEELAKLLMLYILLRKNPFFDEHLDGIVYATCVGLGFAGLENIMYLLSNIDHWQTVAVTRGLFSVPGHFFFAVAMGYFLSIAHFSSRTYAEKRLNYTLAILVPILLHGTFDALLMVADASPSVAVVCMIGFLIFVHYVRRYSRRLIARLKMQAAADNLADDLTNDLDIKF